MRHTTRQVSKVKWARRNHALGSWLPIVVLICALALGVGPSVRAQTPNRVGLVIAHGDGSAITRCVSFDEPEISGYDALRRSGVEIVVAQSGGLGAAVCSIDGEGCAANDCFCECKGSPCIYWSYWHLEGNAWAYSALGASAYAVRNGAVEGWKWGDGSPPPVIAFEQICTPPTVTPVPATDTPLPPTATPVPTPAAWFRLDANPIDIGTCTVVRWDTWNATEVYLDGERVNANGSRDLCPTVPQELHLRVVDAAGDRIYTLILGLTGTAQAPTTTPSPQALPSEVVTVTPTAPHQATASVVLSPSPTPRVTRSATPPATATEAMLSPSANPPEPSAALTATSPVPAVGEPDAQSEGRARPAFLGYVGLTAIIAGLVGLTLLLARRRR